MHCKSSENCWLATNSHASRVNKEILISRTLGLAQRGNKRGNRIANTVEINFRSAKMKFLRQFLGRKEAESEIGKLVARVDFRFLLREAIPFNPAAL